MKAKTLSQFVLAIFILYAMANTSAPLAAGTNTNTNVVINDIEYLAGDDFVQLHFKIDRMIPIPDVFYPDKNDNTRIVMRMNDVTVDVPKNLFTFESSVIDYIKINRKTNHNYVDVEIHLKGQVNYRVFTNQKGLYIEFPNIKIKSEGNPTPSVSTIPAAPPTQALSPAPANKNTTPEPGKNMPPRENLNKTTTTMTTNKKTTPTVIKDILISEKRPNRIKFKVIMTGQPDVEVIPISEGQVRLAIDFKNTRCKRMQKTVNLLNVKKVRGAYNRASVYRVVFDLRYLKNYRVSPNPQNKNVLEVEFFDNLNHLVDKGAASKTKPKKKKVMAANSKAKPVGVTDTGTVEVGESAIKPQKQESAAREQGNDGGNGGDGSKRNITITNIDDANGNGNNIKIDTSTNTITISNEDFFENEKSQVTVKNETPEDKDKKITPSDQNQVKEGTGASMQYLKKTIDEGEKEYIGEPMTFNFHNADLRDVITIIARIAGKNIVLAPGISGRVTSQLSEVPWDQALDLFLKINGLDYVEEGNILRIGRVEELALEAEQRRKLREARTNEAELSVITRTLSFTKVAKVAPLLQRQLSRRGGIIMDDRSNTLIISEVPSNIETLDKLIDTIDVPNPQVSIEARVVESRTTVFESLGIQWGYNFISDAAYGNQTTLKFPNSLRLQGNQFTSLASPLVGPLGGYAVNLPADGASAGTVFSIGNVVDTVRLDFALSSAQSKGLAKIISSPKTTTQNNMEASIMQGKMIPVQIIQNNTITIQYRPAVLELKVTPQITAEGTVIMTLAIDNNSADFANLVNGIPPIITQSIETTVMVDDGGTVVIGGLYLIEKSTTKENVPFFSKIPILGNLFRSSTKRGEQREVLIFITPRIVK
jgi:type IV pilus secretin PilQ/predicted competence protein